MKTRNDCEIACDCVKRANVVLHVGLCEEIFARKHTATHKPTSAQPLSAAHSDQRDIHTRINRLWSPLTYGLGGNKIASRCAAPKPPMTDRCRHRNCFPTRPAQAFPKKETSLEVRGQLMRSSPASIYMY